MHIGYLAAIVAAANAGGAGSVVGDTTTTMMWLDGVAPLDVLHAYVAADRRILRVRDSRRRASSSGSRPSRRTPTRRRRRWTGRALVIVVLILGGAIAANVYANRLPHGEARRVSRTSARPSSASSCC